MKHGRGGKWLGASCATLLCCLLAGAARAQSKPEFKGELYETQRTERALEARSFTIDPAPAGKRIAFIEVAREDVLVDDELWPVWPNMFHWLTTEDTIRRELLFSIGERYDTARVEETMRNLRALGIFALVRIVAVRAPQPDSVGLLVYTRDLWSLRLETGFTGTGDALNASIFLTERNFLGRNKLLSARFFLDPKKFSLGEQFIDPRLLGGELSLSERFDVFFNRGSGKPEGSQGLLAVGRPLRDLSERWGWSASASYVRYVKRELVGSEIASYLPDGTPCKMFSPECLRSVWDDNSYAASVSGSYRRGEAYKQTFSLGAGYTDHDVAANEETGLLPGQEQAFEDLLLPVARRQVYPYVNYALWLPRYAVFQNLSTFGKSENVRIGPSAAARFAVPLEAFGSSTNSIKIGGDMGYVIGDGHALLEASVTADARLEEGRVVDQSAGAVLRGATPDWLLGRLVLYSSWDGLRNDTAKTQVTLGGDNGLRGYKAGFFRAVGGNRVRANLEWRTLPVVFESIHVGAVVFYDAGAVYTSTADVPMHHGAGAGLRVLFPQFNHSPFRVDFGVPLNNDGFSVLVSYGSDQAIPLTAADDASLAGVQ